MDPEKQFSIFVFHLGLARDFFSFLIDYAFVS